ncbi:MAG: Lipoprotein-releasing system transmembrane protein LolE [Candidatus Anoxychlamydiales bacterium]|nr:Lipoprotein-releasing system transmembrane protein LolE [Candidatus Anoxychlamydiales bacterium]HEU64337.1 FtsX-like permease family protein [Chlamydiota bacterium]
MFEFKIAFKYLLFKKRRLSASLISLLSIFVISLVVWVVLVFLSVTNGIEKNWLKKLTSLNAPVRIAPTDQYYSSYYYMIDSYSSKSDYLAKNISEKLSSDLSDPYDGEIDIELARSFPKPIIENGKLLDPIKKLYKILENENSSNLDISYQDYELSAAQLRLTLNRTKKDLFTEFKDERVNFLTQMSYLLSMTEKNPNLKSLIEEPTSNDLNNFLNHMDKSFDSAQKDIPNFFTFVDKNIFQKRLTDLFANISIDKIELEKGYSLDLNLLKVTSPIKALMAYDGPDYKRIILSENSKAYPGFISGEITKEKDEILFKTKDKVFKISKNDSLHLGENLNLNAKLDLNTLKNPTSLNDIKLDIQGKFKNFFVDGKISLKNVNLQKFKFLENFQKNPYFYSFSKDNTKKDLDKLPTIDNKKSILLPKNYRSSNVLIGDSGYLSYATMSMSSNQEIRIPIYVAGFYDPGVLPIGNKCVIVPPEITKTINATNSSFSFDGTPINGVYVWMKDIKKADLLKEKLTKELEKENIASFFNVTTYKDFEFSKDLMQQFQSDRTLFTLIAIIILIAACSNIISMLVLLVNDKKKEIAILRSMGASSKSIAVIFGFCGFIMGLFSSIIGISASIITLKHLDVVIKLLSMIQGHTFFNAAFFGNKLPNDLSFDALIFVLIITPLLALIAGIVPAIKASKVHPSSILRSQ